MARITDIDALRTALDYQDIKGIAAGIVELFAELQRVYAINDRNRSKFDALKDRIGALEREVDLLRNTHAAAERLGLGRYLHGKGFDDVVKRAADINRKKDEN